ncbi:MAG: trehalose-phosphatase [Ahrensia sp.]|nr:trehalose-phosphatase [Ahrensia sp.]
MISLPDKPALFLDFDGTLVGFAHTPNGVDVPDRLVPLLRKLHRNHESALAFVTGRAIDNLDELIGTSEFDAVGVHGAEWRIGGAAVEVVEGAPFEVERDAMRAFAAQHDGVVLQEKSAGFTLHFRQAPEIEETARLAIFDAFAGREDFEIMSGAMMWEARRSGVHKGVGIERLLAQAPYAGRVPIFIGDDVTDEDGHRAVNAVGGVSIKVGNGETCADHRLGDVDSVYEFLERMAT